MKIHEHAEKFFHNGFIKFSYVSDLSGYVFFRDFAGDVYSQFCYADKDMRFKMGTLHLLTDEERKNNGIENIEEEEEQLTKSIQVRLTERQYSRIRKIAKSCNVKPSTYIRNLVNNDIIKNDLEDARGHSIL